MTSTNIEYRVRSGDTLYAIARRYNVTVEVLSLNKASNAKTPSTQAPKTAPYKAGKEVKSFGRVRNDDGVNLREKPQTDGAIQKRLPFNTRVFVSHELPGDWYFVTLDDGSFGYVYSKYVSIHPPDPEAILHKLKPNEGALGIVKQLYTGSTLSWGRDWGQDERYYVNVLVEANRSKGLSGIYKPVASADWDQTRTREKYLIWIPSLDFAKSMRGKVGSGSISHEVWQAARRAAESIGDYILGHAAFSAGLIHGILESIWDLLTGIVDLVELVWKIIKSLITGEFLSGLKQLWDLVEEMDFKALVARWDSKPSVPAGTTRTSSRNGTSVVGWLAMRSPRS